MVFSRFTHLACKYIVFSSAVILVAYAVLSFLTDYQLLFLDDRVLPASALITMIAFVVLLYLRSRSPLYAPLKQGFAAVFSVFIGLACLPIFAVLAYWVFGSDGSTFSRTLRAELSSQTMTLRLYEEGMCRGCDRGLALSRDFDGPFGLVISKRLAWIQYGKIKSTDSKEPLRIKRGKMLSIYLGDALIFETKSDLD